MLMTDFALQNIRSDETEGTLQFRFDVEYLVELEKDLSGYEVIES